MGCDEIMQAFEHDSPGRKSHALRGIGRQSGGNLVGVDELENSQRLFQQKRRSSRFAGAIWPGNHKYGGLFAAHGAVANTGSAPATSVRPARRRSALWRLSARVTDKFLEGFITTSLRWRVIGKFRYSAPSRLGDSLKPDGLVMAINNRQNPADPIDAVGALSPLDAWCLAMMCRLIAALR